MKPSERDTIQYDFLGGAFVSIPFQWLTHYPELGLSPADFLVLIHLMAAQQVQQKGFLTPQELATLCNMSPHTVSDIVESLRERGFLTIGEKLDSDGTVTHYFDLKPLWMRLRGHNPLSPSLREWKQDAVTIFEEEFGRPLSGIECEQIRQWLETDRIAEWMVIEALREAVLANKYSFKYIDRILFDWQRNRIRSRQELEQYRQGYKERMKAREETASARPGRAQTPPTNPRFQPKSSQKAGQKDDRYSAFYQLFPDS